MCITVRHSSDESVEADTQHTTTHFSNYVPLSSPADSSRPSGHSSRPSGQSSRSSSRQGQKYTATNTTTATDSSPVVGPPSQKVNISLQYLNIWLLHVNYSMIWSQCYLSINTSEHAHLDLSQSGRYSIYLPRRDGRLSLHRWFVTYRDGLPARRWSPIQVLTGPSVD